jgi:hypothetical protein
MQAQELRNAGKEPYAYSYVRTHMAAELHEQFKDLPDGEMADLQVQLQQCLGKLLRGHLVTQDQRNHSKIEAP